MHSPACQLRLLFPLSKNTTLRSQRTDHRRTMADTVDEALATVYNDRKPCPPSPSPSPDANECTGAFIRLQYGLALSNRATLTHRTSDSKLHMYIHPNRTNPLQETGTRGFSRASHTQECHQYCTSSSPPTPGRITDVNSPPTRHFPNLSNSHTSTHST